VSSRSGYQRPDAHTRAAKAAGYPARSVFKLEEIDRRCRLFKGGQRVLDLGAAPGSWSLYASERVGLSGRVLAVDLSPIEIALPNNVRALQLDLLSEQIEELVALGPYQVVMSDMAPRTSGSKVRDQALSQELCERALAIARKLGATGSHFVTKLFMNSEYPSLKAAVKAQYQEMRLVRPEATRTQSTEVFLVGLSRKAPAAASPEPVVP
jgi:23S rRNA (uridine2552-2'-O)-methyltransferase